MSRRRCGQDADLAFVDQLLDVLGQLPAELHPILLAETALALRLTDGLATQPTDPPAGNGWR